MKALLLPQYRRKGPLDLAGPVEFCWKTAYDNIQAVRPGMPVFKLSAKTGDGMDEYLRFLVAQSTELRSVALV